MRHIPWFSIIWRLGAVITGGTVFFRYVEGWTWIDSYFFTVVTISTVGYGHPIPATDIGKIGTTVLIFAGLGVFAVALQQIAVESMAERDGDPGMLRRMMRRMNRQDHHRHEHHHPTDHHDDPRDD